MWLRTTRPDLPRPFRVPLGGFHFRGVWIGYVPVAAIVMCLGMVCPVALDITAQARRGDIIPAAVLGGYALIGVAIYVFYGLRRGRTAVVAVEQAT